MIQATHGWRILSRCYRLRDRFLPPSSRRRRVVQSLFDAALGLNGLVRRLGQRYVVGAWNDYARWIKKNEPGEAELAKQAHHALPPRSHDQHRDADARDAGAVPDGPAGVGAPADLRPMGIVRRGRRQQVAGGPGRPGGGRPAGPAHQGRIPASKRGNCRQHRGGPGPGDGRVRDLPGPRRHVGPVRAVRGRPRRQRRAGGRRSLLRRGRDRRRRASPHRAAVQAGLVAGRLDEPKLHLSSRRLPPRVGGTGRRRAPGLRRRPGLRPGAAGHGTGAKSRPHPQGALPLAHPRRLVGRQRPGEALRHRGRPQGAAGAPRPPRRRRRRDQRPGPRRLPDELRGVRPAAGFDHHPQPRPGRHPGPLPRLARPLRLRPL